MAKWRVRGRQWRGGNHGENEALMVILMSREISMAFARFFGRYGCLGLYCSCIILTLRERSLAIYYELSIAEVSSFM